MRTGRVPAVAGLAAAGEAGAGADFRATGRALGDGFPGAVARQFAAAPAPG